MCNNFIEDVAWKVGRKVCKCDCGELKRLCVWRNPKFQLTSKNIRSLFTETEFYGAHGYDFSVMFTNFNYCKEFVDMALCYLHEGDIKKFFLLISHMSEFNYGNLNINSTIKVYAKKEIEKHLSCISLSLLEKYYVHVGFGEWNERDELRPMEFLLTHKCKRFANKSLEIPVKKQNYISVSLSYWLHIFLTQHKPRSYMYEVLTKINENHEDPNAFLPDYKFEQIKLKKEVFKMSGNFNQKLGKRILNVLSCECVRYKEFQYVPNNIRNIIKSFQFHSHDKGFMYNICRFQKERDADERDADEKDADERDADERDADERDTDEIPVVPLFLDIALCCLYEKDYEEFVNIAGQVGKELNLGMYLKKHIDIVNYNDAKKYRVNIDMKMLRCKLYLRAGKKDDRIKRHDDQGMFKQCTDYERYGIPFSDRFININFDRFLSDLLIHPDSFERLWNSLRIRGLKNNSNIFL
jgi:hypothetical protein